MSKIYKYPLGKEPGRRLIDAPIVEILGVFLDPHGQPCLYAIVNPEGKHNIRDALVVYIFWTGCELPNSVPFRHYLTTLQVDGLMCHYFICEQPLEREL